MYSMSPNNNVHDILYKLISDFDNDKAMQLAKEILDDYRFEYEDKDIPQVQKGIGGGEMVIPTIIKIGKKDLNVVLRDHKGNPIKKDYEIKIRKSFDRLLDFYSKLYLFYYRDILNVEDLLYFEYYMRKIVNDENVINYINTYNFMLVKAIIVEYRKIIK